MSTYRAVYSKIQQGKELNHKQFAVLIDPDKLRLANMKQVIDNATQANIDFFFVGGSLIVNNELDACLQFIKQHSDIPTILFPGSTYQISPEANAILFLSLISGRNPELLIGKHVLAAPYLKQSGLEVLSTGYMLIDGGTTTTATYVSNTLPIPHGKVDIAVATAMAGELLGLKLLFLDVGSGAKFPVHPDMIREVSAAIQIPLIVGGGIKHPKQAAAAANAGADIIVVGNAIERDPGLVSDLVAATRSQV